MVDLNVVLVSGVQQSDSVIHVYLFQVIFPYRLLQNIEYSSLPYLLVLLSLKEKKKQTLCSSKFKVVILKCLLFWLI